MCQADAMRIILFSSK